MIPLVTVVTCNTVNILWNPQATRRANTWHRVRGWVGLLTMERGANKQNKNDNSKFTVRNELSATTLIKLIVNYPTTLEQFHVPGHAIITFTTGLSRIQKLICSPTEIKINGHFPILREFEKSKFSTQFKGLYRESVRAEDLAD